MNRPVDELDERVDERATRRLRLVSSASEFSFPISEVRLSTVDADRVVCVWYDGVREMGPHDEVKASR